MRRYGIARYLTTEQIERAATARYRSIDSLNCCERGDCWNRGEYVPSTRTADGACPLGVALDPCSEGSLPAIDDVEWALSKSGSSAAVRRAAASFMHDIDSGKIGPDDVAAALGYAADQSAPRPSERGGSHERAAVPALRRADDDRAVRAGGRAVLRGLPGADGRGRRRGGGRG